MTDDVPRATAAITRHPISPLLAPFPIVCFVGAFITDLAYWATTNIIWETFSVWLLVCGLVIAGFAMIAALIDLIFNRLFRAMRPTWPQVFGSSLVLILSVINALVHSRDGYTAVVPTGLTLSAVVVLLMLFTIWFGRKILYRQTIGARM